MAKISDPTEVDPIWASKQAVQAADGPTSSVPSYTTPTPKNPKVLPADPEV